jgi:hypothetical protein
MPRLADLLAWLTEPGLESVWVLLDIKLDDDPELLLAAIAKAIASVAPGEECRPWRERVVVGVWNVRLLFILILSFFLFYPFSSFFLSIYHSPFSFLPSFLPSFFVFPVSHYCFIPHPVLLP